MPRPRSRSRTPTLFAWKRTCGRPSASSTRGFTLIRESLNAAEAWLGSLPGHAHADVRRPVISTLDLAHPVALCAVWAGEAENAHLDGPALTEARTDGTTPFRLNLHTGDVGHTLIVGPTGAGKSVLLALIALQWTRYPGAQVFKFDKRRSARAAMLSMGGAFLALGAEGRPALQPLRDIDTPAGAAFASEWLAGTCAAEGTPLDPALKAALWDALQSLAAGPAAERTLTGLCLLLQAPQFRAALRPFTLEGPYGHLLDGDTEAMEFSGLACFEMEALLQTSAAAAAVLTHLFHRLEARLGGRPTLLLLDEAWLCLDHPVFAPRLRDWLKTLRKKNVAVVFATQPLDNIDRAAIAPVLVEACPVRIFLANERARKPAQAATYRRFGLNSRQVSLIAEAVPRQDYYHTSPLGCRLFEPGLAPSALALCAAASPADQALIDRLCAEAGPAGLAYALLRARGPGWAGDLLAAWPGAGAPPIPETGNKDPALKWLETCAVLLASPLLISAPHLALAPAAEAQAAVYDPANPAENIPQAARALQQIDNQVRQLSHEIDMIAKMARDLESLPVEVADAVIRDRINRIEDLIPRAGGMGADVAAVDRDFYLAFPESYGAAPPPACVLVAGARGQSRRCRRPLRPCLGKPGRRRQPDQRAHRPAADAGRSAPRGERAPRRWRPPGRSSGPNAGARACAPSSGIDGSWKRWTSSTGSWKPSSPASIPGSACWPAMSPASPRP